MRSGVLAAVLGAALVGVGLPSDAWAMPARTSGLMERYP